MPFLIFTFLIKTSKSMYARSAFIIADSQKQNLAIMLSIHKRGFDQIDSNIKKVVNIPTVKTAAF